MDVQQPNTGMAGTTARRVEARSGAFHSKACIIEDIRAASAELRSGGYLRDRIAHNEMMTSTGTQYLGSLLAGEYQMIWVATPTDWHVRLPGKRTGPHYDRNRNLMAKARAPRMRIVVMGPPSYF